MRPGAAVWRVLCRALELCRVFDYCVRSRGWRQLLLIRSVCELCLFRLPEAPALDIVLIQAVISHICICFECSGFAVSAVCGKPN